MSASELSAEQKRLIKEYLDSELKNNKTPTLTPNVVPEKKRRAKGVKTEKNEELQKEYLTARSNGETSYSDKRGYVRQMTYNQWVKKNKAPSFNEEDGSFNIPTADLYDIRTLVMKTLGSRVSRRIGSANNKYLQTGISYFLKMLDDEDKKDLPDLLKDSNFVEQSIKVITDYIGDLSGAPASKPAAKPKAQSAKNAQE